MGTIVIKGAESRRHGKKRAKCHCQSIRVAAGGHGRPIYHDCEGSFGQPCLVRGSRVMTHNIWWTSRDFDKGRSVSPPLGSFILPRGKRYRTTQDKTLELPYATTHYRPDVSREYLLFNLLKKME